MTGQKYIAAFPNYCERGLSGSNVIYECAEPAAPRSAILGHAAGPGDN